jgi:hypothetical protein
MKKAKDQLTNEWNMAGEIRMPLDIGKFKKSGCFKNMIVH